jgi:chorismate dehydratase
MQRDGPDHESQSPSPTGDAAADALRIGGVPYQVGDALLAGLAQEPQVALTREVPSRLIEGLRHGQFEGALVSSIEAFREPGYTALRGLGIACDEEVGSVRLFVRGDPAQVRSLALDSGSRTSVALSEILLRRRFGAAVQERWEIEPTRRPDELDADAVLLIGDAGAQADPGERRVIDLGRAWWEWKGLPFVFALWLFRTHSERMSRASVLFARTWQEARDRGVDCGTGGLIRYELTAAHHAGLAAFRSEAAALGLCPGDIAPEWIGSVAGTE